MADDNSSISPEVTLCDLMLRLKVENPEFGRKEVHSAVMAEGPEWEKTTFADVDKTWRRMKKKNAKNNKENISHSDTNSNRKKECSASSGKGQELGACGGICESNKGNSSKDKLTEPSSHESCEPKELTEDEVKKALFYEKAVTTDGKQSKALEKQLKMLRENPYVNYVVFTPPYESNDCAIQLSDPMGEIFFNVMWNRVVKAPFGSRSISRELWLIYQQLNFNLMPKYKKMLRKQLEEEFGVDPFDGKVQKEDS